MTAIIRPTLVLDKKICLRNIEKMTRKATEKGLLFRPHFKTHQSAAIGEWFRQAGVKCITVSSVQMAEYFAGHGWNDITVAFPLNIHEIKIIDKLAAKINLNVLIENEIAAKELSKNIRHSLGVFIKIDTGYHRTGIGSSKISTIQTLLSLIEKNNKLHFKGFLSHTGNTYHVKSVHEIFSLHYDALLRLNKLKQKFIKSYPGIKISLGDTPSATLCTNFDGVDEIRPGNFVFYDLMQQNLGVCTFDDIAVRLVCPVVSKHPSRNEIVIYGGAVHLSKESILNINGKPSFGRISILKEGKKTFLDPLNYVARLSQEHGILKVTQKEFGNFEVGDLVEIIPVHSCLTADLMRRYLTTEGEIIEMMPKF